ncbi:PEP-CTERM sorting domain-containing protein [bacterium]|jgi:hypothetical protein|nr:PEP-CTERM sorting domain-containing protein [bacterium]
MKLFKKVLAGVAVAAALATSAQASVINVGGVSWDPDAILDFNGTSASLTQTIDANGGLSGYGVITVINGHGAYNAGSETQGFCASGCELTIQYGGFTPVGGAVFPIAGSFGQVVNYSGGYLNIYVDSTPDVSASDPLALTAGNTGTGDGSVLWLGMTGHEINGVSLAGTNLTLAVGSSFQGFLSGLGQFDVIGGLAAGNLNTNTRADGSDLSVSTTFTNLTYANVPTVGLVPVFATGSGTFTGNSIPEPESLALVGLGLLGLAASRRRKSVK